MTLDRRAFTAGSIAFLVAPRAAAAQPPAKIYRVGFLSASSVPDLLEALRDGLRELGWIEGQNFILETRFAESRFDRTSELAAELVRRNVDVIVVSATSM